MKSRTADPAGFSAFLGIDWSGAKTQSHAGLQLAHAIPGNGVPLRVPPPLSKCWSRQQVSDYLVTTAENAMGKKPVLVGIDFAFAHPFADKDSYFPETDLSPANVVSLWAMVDQVNVGQHDLYGGAMFQHALWGDYYLAPPTYQARHYASRRRVTEIAAWAAGRIGRVTATRSLRFDTVWWRTLSAGQAPEPLGLTAPASWSATAGRIP